LSGDLKASLTRRIGPRWKASSALLSPTSDSPTFPRRGTQVRGEQHANGAPENAGPRALDAGNQRLARTCQLLRLNQEHSLLTTPASLLYFEWCSVEKNESRFP
jgi:hypothetical protein